MHAFIGEPVSTLLTAVAYALVILTIAGWPQRGNTSGRAFSGVPALACLLLLPPSGLPPLLDPPYSALIGISLLLAARLFSKAQADSFPWQQRVDQAFVLQANRVSQGWGTSTQPCRRYTGKSLYPAADSVWHHLERLFRSARTGYPDSFPWPAVAPFTIWHALTLLGIVAATGAWCALRGLPGFPFSFNAFSALPLWILDGLPSMAGGGCLLASGLLVLAGRLPAGMDWAEKVWGWAACGLLVSLFSSLGISLSPTAAIGDSISIAMLVFWLQVLGLWLLLLRTRSFPVFWAAGLLGLGCLCLLMALAQADMLPF